MLKLTYEIGFKDKQIVNPDSIDISKLTTDRDFIVAYAKLSTASHFRAEPLRGNEAYDKAKQIVDQVRLRLERVGWHAHIFKTGSCECRCNKELYLYAAICGMPTISEVPFSQKSPELTENELFNNDGSLREMFQTMALLKKRIGDEALNPDVLLEDNEITQETYETIRAIMDRENLVEVHEVNEDNRTFRSGPKEYTWRDSDYEAEREAREYLEDGEMWKMAVENGYTTQGLDDWVEQVLSIDGWQNELCRYDGCSYELENGKVYWRIN